MQRILMSALLALSLLAANAAVARSTQDYLPPNTSFDADVPTPEDVFGFSPGEWHLRPEQIQHYLRVLARHSDRVSLEPYGSSHEQRPLVLARITAPERQSQLNELKATRSKREAASDDPLVLWMGYSVHGNESSGANASVVFAYYLAAAQDESVQQWLNGSVVLVDPVINPDGLARFAGWVNRNRGKTTVSNPDNREHNEPWPGGRTNHYWFDLNRDWLLLTHPSSQARIRTFHDWHPHVLTDFHEMGSNATFFFQPGVPERTHPLTPQANQDLTAKLGNYHAEALDKAGELYWSGEGFDDFYYGKGSTYPDALGSIGILFEQASSRAHLRDTDNGQLSFADTILNQVRTSISTIRGAWELRSEISEYQNNFADRAMDFADSLDHAGYLIDFGDDRTAAARMAAMLGTHGIDVRHLDQARELDGAPREVASSLIVPLAQPQARLIEGMFERRKQFKDETFYDVSSFNLADAFDAQLVKLSGSELKRVSGDDWASSANTTELGEDAIAVALPSGDSGTFEALSKAYQADLLPRLVTKAMTVLSNGESIELAPGTIIMPRATGNDRESINNWLKSVPATQTVINVDTGLTATGIDLGSRDVVPLPEPKILLVVGDGTNAYEAGEIWHLLDARVGITTTLVERDRLPSIELSKYTHILMPDGRYKSWNKNFADELNDWVRAGGHLLAQRDAAHWMQSQIASKDSLRSEDDDESNDETQAPMQAAYGDYSEAYARHLIGGAIFRVRMDTSHPAGFGMQDEILPVLKADRDALQAARSPFENVGVYANQPLQAGYSSDAQQQRLKAKPAVVVQRHGRGSLWAFADNLNFRGVWRGGNRVYLNALFFAPALNTTRLPEDYPALQAE